MNQSDTRIAIIQAAERIIKNQGLAKLTISKVAEEASLSKGGVLYHFPSKDALVQGMLQYALDVFEQHIERRTEHDLLPGAWARGYIEGTFSPDSSVVRAESASASALVASSGLNPSLMEPYIEQQKDWIPKLKAAGLDEMTALMIRFAVDGLWLNEALGIKPLADEDRSRFIQHLLSITYTSDHAE